VEASGITGFERGAVSNASELILLIEQKYTEGKARAKKREEKRRG